MTRKWTRLLCVAAIPLLSWSVDVRSTHAAGPAGAPGSANTSACADVPGGCGGIQVVDTHPILSPQEQLAVQRKLAAQQQWLAAHPDAVNGPGIGSASPAYQSGPWYYSNNYLSKPEPNASHNNYGASYGGGWWMNATHTSISCCHNPNADQNFYYDLCGPGSTTFTVHTWQPSNVSNFSDSYGDGEGLSNNGVSGWGYGWYGFLYDAAYAEMQYNGGSGGLWWSSTDVNEKNFINAHEGAVTLERDPYDMGRPTLTETNFKSDMAYDIENAGGNILALVDTSALPNWGGSGVAHIVSVNGWDPTDQKVNYADTADQDSQTGGTYRNGGNFSMSEYNFYHSAIFGSYGGREVIW